MKTYKFKAKIGGESGDSCSVYFPYDAEREFGTRARVPAKAVEMLHNGIKTPD
jgi:hypothetical protein